MKTKPKAWALAAMLLSIGAVVGLTGCEALPGGGSSLFTAVPPQTRTFEVDRKDVFYASQLALKRMDFSLTRAKEAQGEIEAHSGLRSTEKFGASRQFTVRIDLTGLDSGRTDVAVLFTEVAEGDFAAGATRRALRQHGLYDSFFEFLAQILTEQAKSGGVMPVK